MLKTNQWGAGDIRQPANGLPRPWTAVKAAQMYPAITSECAVQSHQKKRRKKAATMGTQPARLGRQIGLPKLVDCSRVVLFIVYTLFDEGEGRGHRRPLLHGLRLSHVRQLRHLSYIFWGQFARRCSLCVPRLSQPTFAITRKRNLVKRSWFIS